MLLQLREFSPFRDDDDFEAVLKAVLATAFQGQPVPENTPFNALNEFKQRALRGITELESDFWNIGSLMRYAMISYGFNFWDQERIKAYITGTETE